MKFSFVKRCLILMTLVAFVSLQSCKKNDDVVVKAGASGYFVVNEGSFGNGNTSLSFYDRKTDVMSNNVFALKNGRPLGDQAESMAIFQNKGYVVVQNSGKVEVINIDDFSSIATITDLPSPRYFLGISNNKGYISDWGADGVTGTVKVVDLTTFKVTKTIATGKGANRMLKVTNLVYVTNSGGFDKDNTVSVIDTNTDAVTGTITVGDNPNSIVADNNGKIWVASSGAIAYNNDFSINYPLSSSGSLSVFAVATTTELTRLSPNKITAGPANLNTSPDGATLYWTYDNEVYSMAVTLTAFPTAPLILKSYYGFSVDPFNGDLIGFDAGSFSAAGRADVYSSDGTLKKSYDTGIGPNGATFK